jgi:hypothetical protein
VEVQDPYALLAGWVLGPLVTVAVSVSLGAGIARLAGVKLGPLVAPLGYLTGVVAMTLLLKLGVDGRPAVAVLAVAAVVSAAMPLRTLVRERGRPVWSQRAAWLPTALAATAAFCVAMSPIVGSGRSGVSGYVLNNDPAVHSTLVEYLADHGTSNPETEFPTSYTEVAQLTQTGYPIGSHVWPMFASTSTGVEVFHVWGSSIAVAAAMLALVAFAALRRLGRPWITAAAAALVPAGYLFYSYIAQGSGKEVLTAVAVYGTVVIGVEVLRQERAWRALPVLLVGPAAAFFAFGAASAAWLVLPAAVLLALVLWRLRSSRPSRTALAAGAGAAVLLVLAALPLVRDALDYVDEADASLRDPAQTGNLLVPIPRQAALNLWFAYDYRIQPATWETLSALAPWLALALAVVGLAFAVSRREPAIPLAVGSGAVAAVIISTRYAIYMDAKSYAILAPALGLATAAGIIALLQRRGAVRALGTTAAALVVAGVLAGAALAYQGAWNSPKERFNELAEIADLVHDDGPILVNDREEWAYYFLRDSEPVESWGFWQGRRGLKTKYPPPLPHTPDFDDFQLDHVERFELLLDRKHPGGSRPPANFRLEYETPDYTLWRRTEPAPAVHVGLGVGKLDNAARLDCGSDAIRSLFTRARQEDKPLVVSLPGAAPVRVINPSRWRAYETRSEILPPPMINRRGGFAAAWPDLEAGTYEAWIQGSFGPGVRLLVEGIGYGEVNGDLGLPSAWHDLGTVSVPDRRVDFALVALEKPAWQAGSQRSDLTGELVVEARDAGPKLRRVGDSGASRLCGERLDWIELPGG